MNRLSYADFLERRSEFDEAVARTPEVTGFCCASVWQCAAHDSLHRLGPEANHLIVEDGGNWLTFVQRRPSSVFFPLESAWMFGSPLIGDPEQCVELLRSAAARWLRRPASLCIGGVRQHGRLHRRLLQMRDFCLHFEEMPGTDVMEIDLGDGFEAWLSRRSKKFRKSARQLSISDDIEIVDGSLGSADELYDRIIEIQRQTYKWQAGGDIFQDPPHANFYRALLDELHARSALRILFARRDGKDIAHIFGARTGDAYRGFQMSYIEPVRGLGIGNALQLENLRRRAAEGITVYDLGMHSPYKERWADRRDRYVGIFLVL